MQAEVFSAQVQCPYCWEEIDVLIDNCGEDQQYIEDCQVCCRPVGFKITIDAQTRQLQINVYAQDDA